MTHKLTWAELAAIGGAWRAKLAAELASPEYRARQIELERKTQEARAAFAAWVASGYPASANAVVAVMRDVRK